jgi:hypothetical protein
MSRLRVLQAGRGEIHRIDDARHHAFPYLMRGSTQA